MKFHSRKALGLAAIATMTVAVTAPATAPAGGHKVGAVRYFQAKPSGIGCGAFRLHREAATLRCDLPFRGSHAVFLHRRGPGTIKRVPSFLHPRKRTVRPLRLNYTHSFGPFSCTSRPTAVSCRIGGHGFTVGRRFQLVF